MMHDTCVGCGVQRHWSSAKDLLVKADGTLQQLADHGEINMDSVPVLSSFIERTVNVRLPPDSALSALALPPRHDALNQCIDVSFARATDCWCVWACSVSRRTSMRSSSGITAQAGRASGYALSSRSHLATCLCNRQWPPSPH